MHDLRVGCLGASILFTGLVGAPLLSLQGQSLPSRSLSSPRLVATIGGSGDNGGKIEQVSIDRAGNIWFLNGRARLIARATATKGTVQTIALPENVVAVQWEQDTLYYLERGGSVWAMPPRTQKATKVFNGSLLVGQVGLSAIPFALTRGRLLLAAAEVDSESWAILLTKGQPIVTATFSGKIVRALASDEVRARGMVIDAGEERIAVALGRKFWMYDRGLLIGVDPTGSNILLIDRKCDATSAPGWRCRLVRLTAEGDTLYSRMIALPVGILDPVKRDTAIARFVRSISALSKQPEELVRRHLTSALKPLSTPTPAQRLLAASDGSVWIRIVSERETPSSWLVVSPSGMPSYKVLIPSDYALLAVENERVWLTGSQRNTSKLFLSDLSALVKR